MLCIREDQAGFLLVWTVDARLRAVNARLMGVCRCMTHYFRSLGVGTPLVDGPL